MGITDTLDQFGPQGLGKDIFNINLIVRIIVLQNCFTTAAPGSVWGFLGIFSIPVIHDTLKNQRHPLLVQELQL